MSDELTTAGETLVHELRNAMTVARHVVLREGGNRLVLEQLVLEQLARMSAAVSEFASVIRRAQREQDQ